MCLWKKDLALDLPDSIEGYRLRAMGFGLLPWQIERLGDDLITWVEARETRERTRVWWLRLATTRILSPYKTEMGTPLEPRDVWPMPGDEPRVYDLHTSASLEEAWDD